MELTEKDAAIAYAQAWNNLDCSNFLELLAEDARYASMYVCDELIGKDNIADYFIDKIEAVKNANSKVVADMGITRTGSAGRDCVCIFQGENKKTQAVVIFEVANNKIKRYDLCISELYDVELTGECPK